MPGLEDISTLWGKFIGLTNDISHVPDSHAHFMERCCCLHALQQSLHSTESLATRTAKLLTASNEGGTLNHTVLALHTHSPHTHTHTSTVLSSTDAHRAAGAHRSRRALSHGCVPLPLQLINDANLSSTSTCMDEISLALSVSIQPRKNANTDWNATGLHHVQTSWRLTSCRPRMLIPKPFTLLCGAADGR